MWELDCEEGWALKNWCFELWCWRRLLRVPWTARKSNQSILKEISPGISLEGMMLKLKLQYFGHLMRRVDSLEKTLMLGGIGGKRRRGRQRMRWLDGITDSMNVESQWTPGVGDGQGGLVCCDSWGRKESDTTGRLIWSDPIWSILHMVMDMFQSYCLDPSHPFLPPLCPQVCSQCLCLHCCSSNRFISTIFIDFIYVHSYMPSWFC